MDINNDLQQILLQNELLQKQQKANKLPKGHAEFAEIFSQASETETLNSSAVASSDTNYKDLSVTNLATINAMLTGQLDSNKGSEGLNEFEDEINSITAMLDGLDSYATKIAQSQSDKSAWEELSSITSQIGSLKQSKLPKELSDIVDEIDMLATTEQIKMNRGDYDY